MVPAGTLTVYQAVGSHLDYLSPTLKVVHLYASSC